MTNWPIKPRAEHGPADAGQRALDTDANAPRQVRSSPAQSPDPRLGGIIAKSEPSPSNTPRATSFTYSRATTTQRAGGAPNTVLGLSKTQIEAIRATNGGHLTLTYLEERHTELTG